MYVWGRGPTSTSYCCVAVRGMGYCLSDGASTSLTPGAFASIDLRCICSVRSHSNQTTARTGAREKPKRRWHRRQRQNRDTEPTLPPVNPLPHDDDAATAHDSPAATHQPTGTAHVTSVGSTSSTVSMLLCCFYGSTPHKQDTLPTTHHVASLAHRDTRPIHCPRHRKEQRVRHRRAHLTAAGSTSSTVSTVMASAWARRVGTRTAVQLMSMCWKPKILRVSHVT